MLPDSNTLVGAKNNILQVEDIIRKKIRRVIDQKKSQINTMTFNQNLNSLLVGEENGCLSQYGRNLSGDFKKQKEYKDIGIEEIYAINWSGNFAVVGGSKGGISLIDMERRKVITKGIRTAVGSVLTLQFCRVSRNEMHLAVGGFGQNDYSNLKTDWFDVSDLFHLGGNNEENAITTKKKLIK